ncbi:MAG: hypothetical protein ACJ8HI_13780 [Massilia sp.]|jgi:hypothetical protein
MHPDTTPTTARVLSMGEEMLMEAIMEGNRCTEAVCVHKEHCVCWDEFHEVLTDCEVMK